MSGYLTYRQEEKLKSFLVQVRDDQEEEGEEVFYLQLVAVQGGARLPMPRPSAILRVMKSDNANGLFGFTGSCIPDVGAKTKKQKSFTYHYPNNLWSLCNQYNTIQFLK